MELTVVCGQNFEEHGFGIQSHCLENWEAYVEKVTVTNDSKLLLNSTACLHSCYDSPMDTVALTVVLCAVVLSVFHIWKLVSNIFRRGQPIGPDVDSSSNSTKREPGEIRTLERRKRKFWKILTWKVFFFLKVSAQIGVLLYMLGEPKYASIPKSYRRTVGISEVSPELSLDPINRCLYIVPEQSALEGTYSISFYGCLIALINGITVVFMNFSTGVIKSIKVKAMIKRNGVEGRTSSSTYGALDFGIVASFGFITWLIVFHALALWIAKGACVQRRLQRSFMVYGVVHTLVSVFHAKVTTSVVGVALQLGINSQDSRTFAVLRKELITDISSMLITTPLIVAGISDHFTTGSIRDYSSYNLIVTLCFFFSILNAHRAKRTKARQRRRKRVKKNYLKVETSSTSSGKAVALRRLNGVVESTRNLFSESQESIERVAQHAVTGRLFAPSSRKEIQLQPSGEQDQPTMEVESISSVDMGLSEAFKSYKSRKHTISKKKSRRKTHKAPAPEGTA